MFPLIDYLMVKGTVNQEYEDSLKRIEDSEQVGKHNSVTIYCQYSKHPRRAQYR